jgi:hypothetical protein
VQAHARALDHQRHLPSVSADLLDDNEKERVNKEIFMMLFNLICKPIQDRQAELKMDSVCAWNREEEEYPGPLVGAARERSVEWSDFPRPPVQLQNVASLRPVRGTLQKQSTNGWI